MIEEFLSWWGRHLLACVPAGLRTAEGAPDGTVAVLSPGGGLELARRRGGRLTPTRRVDPGQEIGPALRAALDGRPGRVTLAVPPGAMLRRPVELPLAAERNLGPVLRHEMDRLTPFNADEVDWTWSVQSRDKARNRLRLDLLLVPKALTATVCAGFRAAGAPVAALEGSAGVIGLDTAASPWRRRLLAAGTVLCAVLAVAAVATPFVEQSLQLREVEARIAALGPAVAKAEALRRQIAAGTAGADVLATQTATTGEALQVVALMTALLPDDTYLSELGWRNRQVTMTGQSAAASRLIEVLSRDPAIHNPVFAAPVVRDEAAHVDRFSIRTEVAP